MVEDLGCVDFVLDCYGVCKIVVGQVRVRQ